MMMRTRWLLAASPALICAGTPASLDVTVTGIKHTRGTLLTCVWTEKSGFPTCQKSATAIKQKMAITGASMRVRFANLPAGSYAVSVHHDEDGDGKLKTNFIGMPKEGVGVSNNPGGIPSFAKAQIQVGATSAITINMRYL
jgi:uncharacterized protein (DUF2141 family)